MVLRSTTRRWPVLPVGLSKKLFVCMVAVRSKTIRKSWSLRGALRKFLIMAWSVGIFFKPLARSVFFRSITSRSGDARVKMLWVTGALRSSVRRVLCGVGFSSWMFKICTGVASPNRGNMVKSMIVKIRMLLSYQSYALNSWIRIAKMPARYITRKIE